MAQYPNGTIWREATKRLALPEIGIIGPQLSSQSRDNLVK